MEASVVCLYYYNMTYINKYIIMIATYNCTVHTYLRTYSTYGSDDTFARYGTYGTHDSVHTVHKVHIYN